VHTVYILGADAIQDDKAHPLQFSWWWQWRFGCCVSQRNR